jgi:hypothetical protein
MPAELIVAMGNPFQNARGAEGKTGSASHWRHDESHAVRPADGLDLDAFDPDLRNFRGFRRCRLRAAQFRSRAMT